MSMIGIIVSILAIFSILLIAARGGFGEDDNAGEFEQLMDDDEDDKEL